MGLKTGNVRFVVLQSGKYFFFRRQQHLFQGVNPGEQAGRLFAIAGGLCDYRGMQQQATVLGSFLQRLLAEFAGFGSFSCGLLGPSHGIQGEDIGTSV